MGRNNKKGKKSNKKNSKKSVIHYDVKKSILAVFVIVLALIFLLSLFGGAGILGHKIDLYLLRKPFGVGRFVLPFIMILLGILYFRRPTSLRYFLATLGSFLFFSSFLALLHIFSPLDRMQGLAQEGKGGGFIGFVLAYPLLKYLDLLASLIILFGSSLTGLMLLFNSPINTLLGRFNLFKKRRNLNKDGETFVGDRDFDKKEELKNEKEKIKEELNEKDSNAGIKEKNENQEGFGDNIKSISFVQGPEDEEEDEDFETAVGLEKKENFNKPRVDFSNLNWKKPPLDIFEENKKRPVQSNVKQNIQIIKETLKNFGISVKPDKYSVGPTVTQYTFKPAVGVRTSRILALQNDLALALAARSVRIQAPIPGEALIGIEVPNQEKAFVRMQTMLKSKEFKSCESNLCVILGEDVNGKPTIADIEKMPHLLIAGATGTGKSVGINTLLSSLIFQNSPENLRLILVDPKRVELSVYDKIPHLLCPVIVEPAKVVGTLNWAVEEMERRYKLLQELGNRNINSYNGKIARMSKEDAEDFEKLPFIVIVIDELADLMAVHSKEIEKYIVRLAQMARAVGIHLVVSTQRPSVEVLTGLIKANITTRIAFQVATQIDSRTILDRPGAEKLLGNGDLLYLNANETDPVRVQGVYVSEDEVKELVAFVKNQAEELNLQENQEIKDSLNEKLSSSENLFSENDGGKTGDDELYEEAKELVVKVGKASTSMLQRRLSIGYSRAARIVDMLEENGVVSSAQGSRARKVLIGASSKSELNYDDEIADQIKRDKWN